MLIPKIKSRSKKDKKKEKFLQEFLDYQYEQHKDFVDALVRAKVYIHQVYGIETNEVPWEIILQAYLISKEDTPTS